MELRNMEREKQTCAIWALLNHIGRLSFGWKIQTNIDLLAMQPYMNCDVEVGVRDMSNVGGLGENIKNDIKANLETLTGYKVKDITVKFLDLAKSTSKRVV